MSAADIADNKWELTATKPPLTTPAGLAQIALMGFFGLFFLWIVGFAAMGIVMPKKAGLADSYQQMNNAPAQQ